MKTHTDHDRHDDPGLDEPRPGQELRAVRERAGISRDSMAERLRLAPAQLDALERDDYTELPPPAFVRGYFRAYARELGVDPDQYIDAYNRSGISGRDPEIRSGGVTDTSSGGRGGMIGLLLIALVAAGGIGAWWYQQRMTDDGGGSGTADSVEEERAGTGDREPEGADQAASGGGDTDSEDSAAADEANGETASGEGDTSADAPDNDDDAAEPDADDAETASVDIEAMEAGVADADGEAENGDTVNAGATADADSEAEQPAVVVPDVESQAGTDDDPGTGGTEMADAGDTRTADPDEDDGAAEEPAGDEAADDAAASEDAADDSEADATAEATEPGASSPAATDSPTRAATDAAGSGPDEITLEFSSRSWLEVYDDRDRELVYTLYFGSEPITLQGWAPFEIFLGNSPAVTVQFNGEDIDKSAFTRSNNTARFVVDASGARAP